MPGTNRDDLHGWGSGRRPSFFNSDQPTKTAIQTGLAVLCFLLLVRFCLQRCVAWRHLFKARRLSSTQEQTPPTAPIFDEKMHSKSRSYGCRNSAERRNSEDSSDASASFAAPRAVPEHQQRHFFARLPPAPPLTPPELSTSIFACDEDVDGFISQPNPDYMSATSSIPFQNSPPTPRAHSYRKMIPSGAPLPDSQGGASLDHAFSLRSYPASRMFPPPRPGPQNESQSDEDDSPRHNLAVQGEIISVLNENGQGWTRHTRVYGGGVCLACAASGGHEGGFYGATVTPEEMRY